MNIDLPELRGLVADLRIGTIDDPERIGIEIQLWEAVQSWAVYNLKLMDLVQKLGDKIARDSFFATEVLGTATLAKWRADSAGLRTEEEKLITDLAEMDKLISVLRSGKR